jgi:hypothetical protein
MSALDRQLRHLANSRQPSGTYADGNLVITRTVHGHSMRHRAFSGQQADPRLELIKELEAKALARRNGGT